MDDVPRRGRVFVVAALIRRGGRILMSRRRGDQAMPNLWEFPGGKVEEAEAPAAALAREIWEELGCRAEVGRIFDVVFHAYPGFDLVMLVYACRLSGGEPTARQVAEIAWVAPQEIERLELLPADYPLARRLAHEAGGGVDREDDR